MRCRLGFLQVGIHTTVFNSGSGHRSTALCLPPMEGYFSRGPFVHFSLASWDFIVMMPLCSLFLLFLLMLSFSIPTACCSCPFTRPPQPQIQDDGVFHHLLLWQDFHWGHWEISCMCTCSSNSSRVLWKDPRSDPQQTLFSQPCSISFLTQPMPIYFICHQSRAALQSRCCASTLTLIRCLVSRDKMLLH